MVVLADGERQFGLACASFPPAALRGQQVEHYPRLGKGSVKAKHVCLGYGLRGNEDPGHHNHVMATR